MTNSIAPLAALRQASEQLSGARNKVATGLRVSTAKDNPSYWSIATQLKGDRDILKTIRGTLAIAETKANVALTATSAILEKVDGINALLVAALEPGVDRGKIGLSIERLKSEMRDVIGLSSVNGENWTVANITSNVMYQALPSYSLVTSYARQSDGTGALKTVSVKMKDTIMLSTDPVTGGRYSVLGYIHSYAQPGGGTMFYQLLGSITAAFPGTTREVKLTSTTPDYYIDDMLAYLKTVRSGVETTAIALGGACQTMERQGQVNESVMLGMDKQIRTLVEDNLTEQMVRVRALQIRENLCTRMVSLSGSNRQHESLLLFRA